MLKFKLLMDRRIFGFLGLLAVAFLVTTAIFFYAKGYRFNFKQKTIDGTGIIQIGSTPKGAAVYINDEASPRDATDVSLTNLKPGKYQIKLTKNGFIDWKKAVEVRAGLVTQIEALLFPSAPNLKAITFTGIMNPKLSPDNQKLVFAVDEPDKKGLWVLDLSDRPIFFSKEPKQIAKDTVNLSFSESTFEWTPDSKGVLVTVKIGAGKQNYQLIADQLTANFTDITESLTSLKTQWSKDAEIKAKDRLNAFGDEFKKLTEGSKQLLYSPNEERVLIVKDAEAIVYDLKPYLSFDKKPAQFTLPKADSYIWYPEFTQSGHDSRHLILIRKDSISIIESDGKNEMTIYTGNFDPGSVFAWPNGSQLLIMTSLNSSTNKEANIYSLELR